MDIFVHTEKSPISSRLWRLGLTIFTLLTLSCTVIAVLVETSRISFLVVAIFAGGTVLWSLGGGEIHVGTGKIDIYETPIWFWFGVLIQCAGCVLALYFGINSNQY